MICPWFLQGFQLSCWIKHMNVQRNGVSNLNSVQKDNLVLLQFTTYNTHTFFFPIISLKWKLSGSTSNIHEKVWSFCLVVMTFVYRVLIIFWEMHAIVISNWLNYKPPNCMNICCTPLFLLSCICWAFELVFAKPYWYSSYC